MYSIYKHTVPNGKVYIGMTGADQLYKRWKYGSGYKANKAFYEDIIEYGWRNIQHEVLEQVEDKEEALAREDYYINLYRSNDPEYGYNTYSGKSKESKKRYFIQCVETKDVYKTLTQAAAAVGLASPSSIHKAVKNGTTAAGLHWTYQNARIF